MCTVQMSLFDINVCIFKSDHFVRLNEFAVNANLELSSCIEQKVNSKSTKKRWEPIFWSHICGIFIWMKSYYSTKPLL